VLKNLREARDEKLEKPEFIKNDLLFGRTHVTFYELPVFSFSTYLIDSKLYRWYARYERQLPRNFCSDGSCGLIAIKSNSSASTKRVPSVSIFYVNELSHRGENIFILELEFSSKEINLSWMKSHGATMSKLANPIVIIRSILDYHKRQVKAHSNRND